MTNTPVKLAVVGAGNMGANHIRIADQLPEVELVAVVDEDVKRAQSLTSNRDVRAVASVDDLGDDLEAAIVAVPTSHHLSTAESLIRRGVHVLVEKPLAGSIAIAEEILALATEHGVRLAVGHVERFNPSILELPRYMESPIHLEASRVSPFTSRINDGVIFDLMIHDFDIVCSLLDPDAEVTGISGVSRSVKGTTEDLASVSLSFSTGETASFRTSRLGQSKVRTLEVTQPQSSVFVDLLRQDITISRLSSHEYFSDDGVVLHRQANVVERPLLPVRGEPLALEILDFVESVRDKREPRVGGLAGLRAVSIAERATALVVRS